MTLVDFPVKPEAQAYIGAVLGAAGEPDWLAQYRRRALARFAERGFPSRRGEAWRYLDLRPLAEAPLAPASGHGVEAVGAAAAQLAEIAFPAPAARLVLVDGMFMPALSSIEALPAGVHLRPTQAAIGTSPHLVEAALDAFSDDPDHAFAALNAAHFTDGFVLDIAPGVELDRPIEIVHLASGARAGFVAYPQPGQARCRQPRPRDRSLSPARAAIGATTSSRGGPRPTAPRSTACRDRRGSGRGGAPGGAIDVTLGARARFRQLSSCCWAGGRCGTRRCVRWPATAAHCRLDGAFVVPATGRRRTSSRRSTMPASAARPAN